MKIEELLDTVYGLVLTCNFQTSCEIFTMIDEEWNQKEFHKQLYTSINNLIDRVENPDLITVVMEFRKHEWFKASVAADISSLTINIPSDALMMVRSVISQIEYIKQVETATNVTTKINNLISTDNFDASKFVDIVDSAKDKMISGAKEEITNDEALLSIIAKHDKAKQGDVSGIDLGFHQMKNKVLIEDVDVMIIGARPGMGKTALGIQLSINFGIKQNLKVAYFALEMSKEQMIRRVAANIACVNSNKIKFGEMNEQEKNRVYSMQGMEGLDNIKIFDTSKDIRQIRMDLSEMKMSEGLDVIIIDYLQKIDERSGKSLHEKVSKISDGVKRIAQNMKIPVIAFAQLSRAVETRGGDKRPILSDLKESGDIEQDASIVGFLWRPAYYGFMEDELGNDQSNVLELIIAKNREGERGTYQLSIDLTTSKVF